MASFKPRTQNEIFQSLLQAKSNYENLDSLKDLEITDEQSLFYKLTSETVVSLWILWLHLQTYGIWILENVLSIGIAEQEEIRDSSFIGNADWVEYATKLYQDGDEIIINPETNKINYQIEDESNQIIGNSVAVGVPGAAVIKLRGKNSDVLSPEELTRFSTYWSRVGILGINYLIQNSNPDMIKIVGKIKYKGERLQSEIQSEVESVITDYIRNISFNSEFIKNELLKRILAIDGVTDFEITDLQAKPDGGLYSNITFRYVANAGYLAIDSNSPLNDSILYEIERVY